MTYEEQFVAHLPVINGVSALIARQHGLADADREDFQAHVRLKCLEDDYRVLREFRQSCKLRTYLISVVHHLFLDYRNAQWGKWRPSTESVRLGPLAVRLDVLMNRDRMSFEEACEQMLGDGRLPATRAELERLAEIVPRRAHRRMVGEDVVDSLSIPPTGVEEPLRQSEIGGMRRQAHASLVKALAALPPEDRFLLKLRFERGMTVAAIADLTKHPQKGLYRRFDRLFALLRAGMEADGVDGAMIASLLDDPDGPRTRVIEGRVRGNEE